MEQNKELITNQYGNRHTALYRLLMLYIGILLAFYLLMPKNAFAATEQSGGELHAFYPSNAVFNDKMKEYIDSVDSLSFAWGRIDAKEPGALNTVRGKNGNKGFYYPANYQLPVEYAKSKAKSIQLNIYMDSKDCILLLPYEDQRAVMIRAITEHLKSEIIPGSGIFYEGVVIDFEGLRDTDNQGRQLLYEGKPISVHYIQFLKELRAQLEPLSRKFYTAVNPSLYYDGFDYESIIDLSDRVILMAHDYEPTERLEKRHVEQYTGYDALDPVYSMAPLRLVRQALNEMSAAADSSEQSKIWLQITFDSAQWQYDVKNAAGWESLEASALSREGRLTPLYQSIKDRVDNKDGKGVKITYGYNNELQTPYIQYFHSSDKSWNIILYEDSNSIGAKVDLADSYGLGGISLWSLANVPDYTDANGQKYHLDGWTTILDKMKTFGVRTDNSLKTVSFTDASIEKAVRAKLGKLKGKITISDIQQIYRLKLPKGVKSLKDLKQLTHLEYLDASQLGIKDISAIGSLKNLRVLYLQRNKIIDISPLKKLTKLEVLSLNGNKLTDTKSLSKLTSLKKLYLRENSIQSITSLKGLTNLKELYLNDNLIRDYSSLKKISQKSGFLCDFRIQ